MSSEWRSVEMPLEPHVEAKTHILASVDDIFAMVLMAGSNGRHAALLLH